MPQPSSPSRPDPWSPPAPVQTTRRLSTPLSLILVAGLGSFGAVVRLALDGFHGRAAALAVLSIAFAALLRWRPRGVAGTALVLAVLTIAPLLTLSTMGRAPAIVALIGVAVAHAAVVDWSPLPSWPRRDGQIASAALPVILASQAAWLRTGSLLLSGALLLMSLGIVEAYHRVPRRAEAAEARLISAAMALGSAVGALVLLVVVVPLLYVPGALAGAVEWLRRRRTRETLWVTRSIRADEDARDAPRPFAAAEPGVRRLRHLAGGVTVAVLVGSSILVTTERQQATERLATAQAHDVLTRGEPTPFSELDAYRAEEWADDLKEEQSRLSNEALIASDSLVVDVSDFQGRWTNVEDGVRRSTEPRACASCLQATVWIAGGSAAFGLGQRDEHTIASELVRLADQDGIALTVLNLGVPAATLHVEVNKVAERLRRTDAPPDLVIFYDGFNDVVGTIVDSTVNGIQPERPSLLASQDLQRFDEERLDPSTVGPPEDLARLAAEKYRREIERMALAPEFAGIDRLHVFQPDALSSTGQFAAVESVYESTYAQRRYLSAALAAASSEFSDDMINLRDVLDRAPPAFVDVVHTNELGASIVAEALYSRLRAPGALLAPSADAASETEDGASGS